jgi:hypothetical protein
MSVTAPRKGQAKPSPPRARETVPPSETASAKNSEAIPPGQSGWRGFALRWQLREKLVMPVLSSLTTATIIFLAAVLLAPTIRRIFSEPGVPGFPLYCVVEPYNALKGDTVLVDLQIINLSATGKTAEMLDEIVKKGANGRPVSAAIRVVAHHPMVDSIVRVTADSSYNSGKGAVDVARLSSKEYSFVVQSIDPKVVMRFTFVTNMIARVGSRSNRNSNPLRCESVYAGT